MGFEKINLLKDSKHRLKLLAYEHIMKRFKNKKYSINTNNHSLSVEKLYEELNLQYELYSYYYKEENVKLIEFMLDKFRTSSKNTNKHILMLNKSLYCQKCGNYMALCEIDDRENKITLITEKEGEYKTYYDEDIKKDISNTLSLLDLNYKECFKELELENE